MSGLDFQNLCRCAGLPAPVAEYRFCPERKWRVDYAWPGLKVALEVEGAVWVQGRHTRGSGFVKDMEKYNTLAAQGWRLLRCTPAEIKNMKVLRLLSETLNQKRRSA